MSSRGIEVLFFAVILAQAGDKQGDLQLSVSTLSSPDLLWVNLSFIITAGRNRLAATVCWIQKYSAARSDQDKFAHCASSTTQRVCDV